MANLREPTTLSTLFLQRIDNSSLMITSSSKKGIDSSMLVASTENGQRIEVSSITMTKPS
jgi:hypothetical protein